MKKAKAVLSLLMALVMALTGIVTAFAADLEEKEPNNEMAAATVFALADTIKGRLSDDTDVDWFCFEAKEASLVTVKLQHNIVDATAASSYFTVKVVDANGVEEATFTSAGSAAEAVSPAFSVAAGKHYIVVTGGQVTSTTLDYKLSVSVDSTALSEKESNNTIETATPLELSLKGAPKRYIGTIGHEGDVDYYKLTIPENGYIYYYIYNSNGTKGAYDVSLIGYVSGANGVAAAQTFGTVSIGKDDASVISPCTGLAKGTYYLKVSGSVGGYQIRALFTPFGSAEKEYNNTFKTADTLDMTKTFYGSNFDKNDVDVYKFTVTQEKTKLQFVFKADASVTTDGKWNIVVCATDSQILTGGQLTAVRNEKATYSLYDLKPGTYYIMVTSDSATPNSGLYTLSFEAITVDDSGDGNKSFIQKIKDIDWSKFINSFIDWIGKIKLIPMLKAIIESIKKVIGSLK